MSIKETDETRDDIENQIKEREQKLDQMADDMGITVDDKLIIAEEAEKLEFTGVRDFADEIKKHIEESMEAVDDKFKEQEEKLNDNLAECEDAERDFLDRAKTADHNASEINDASRKLQEAIDARSFLDSAKEAADEESSFFNESEGTQRENREASEQSRESQRGDLNNATVPW